MIRYDIEIETACLRAAATLMAGPKYRGNASDATELARLAKAILVAFYSDETSPEMPAPRLPDVI
ncbi:MAG: hypothetical protein IT561_22695 [Alphaproteobacteria bacterium]|nr:hypothetical protein [Alphaproteobacteria bacterium]